MYKLLYGGIALLLGMVILALSPFRINVTVTRQIAQAQDQVVATTQQVITPSESTIAYGDWIYGVVNDDAPILRYYFEGQENDIVSVSMVQGDCGHNLDPYVALLSEDGVRIAEDDNGGFDDAASIYAFTLSKTGTYTVLASRSGMESGETTGDFNLALGTVTPTIMELGEAVPTTLTVDERAQLFQVDLEADTLVRVGARSSVSGLDPYLVVLDPSGRAIATDNDSAEMKMPEIDPLIVPVSGTYTVAVFATQEVGGEAEVYVEESRAIPLTIDQMAEVALTPDQRRAVFVYEGVAGEALNLSLRRTVETFAPQIHVYQGIPADSTRIASARGGRIGGIGLNLSLPADSMYVVVVSRHGAEFGTFEFTASHPS